MCYSAVSISRQLIKYAKHRSDDEKVIQELQKQLEIIITASNKNYFADAYAHPKLLVFTNEKPFEPQLFYWGLIPKWVKTKTDALKIANQTLNARSETIFEKPAFKSLANSKKCIIYLDAFYEYHHFNNKTYPYCISDINDETLAIGGLWEEWPDKETGELINTVTVLTTQANSLLQQIHNNPKLKEPRMPLIISKDKQNEWLQTTTKEETQKFFKPYLSSHLKAYTVNKLKGKGASGNSVSAIKEYYYPELEKLQQ